MSDYGSIIYGVADRIARITLNRPEKRNALDFALRREFVDALRTAERDDEVTLVLIDGAGSSFCSGYDMAINTREPEDAPDGWVSSVHFDSWTDQFARSCFRDWMTIWDLLKPVVAKVHGYCLAGGSEIMSMCDIAFVADDAVIGYPPSRIFGTPTTMLWIYRLGLERAKQYLLTGCEIDAPTALRIGLVSEVHPAAELAGRVEAHAGRFRHIPANQLALNKLLINQAYENMGLRTTQLLGTLFDGVTRHTEEAYQWVESFRDKGFREVIRDRDRPWADYGERPR